MAEFFKHPLALVDSEQVGRGTRVWAFSHVMQGARIGRECNIGEHCYIEGKVIIGDQVVVKNGVDLWNGVRLEHRVFVGPNAVFTNDRFPRSKVFRRILPTTVGEGASIGANATILCGVRIGKYAVVGAGAVVTRDIPNFVIAAGNPARPRGYVCQCGAKLDFPSSKTRCRCGASYRLRNGFIVPLYSVRTSLARRRKSGK